LRRLFPVGGQSSVDCAHSALVIEIVIVLGPAITA
jgi:hypothetical protein